MSDSKAENVVIVVTQVIAAHVIRSLWTQELLVR